MRLELRQLEIVLSICREGSIGAAARKLGLRQPTLSQALARLERELGETLFERQDGVSVRPTPTAELIAAHAAKVLRLIDDLSSTLTSTGQTTLRIGVGPVTRLKPLPKLLLALAREEPLLQISVGLERGEDLLPALVADRYDVVFGYAQRAGEYEDLHRIKIFEDRQIGVANSGHPLTELESVGPRDLLRYKVAGPGLTGTFVDWAGDLSEDEDRNLRSVECLDYGLIKDHVRQGSHVAIGPRFIFEHELAHGELITLPLTWSVGYECWMIFRPRLALGDLFKRVAAAARAEGLRA